MRKLFTLATRVALPLALGAIVLAPQVSAKQQPVLDVTLSVMRGGKQLFLVKPGKIERSEMANKMVRGEKFTLAIKCPPNQMYEIITTEAPDTKPNSKKNISVQPFMNQFGPKEYVVPMDKNVQWYTLTVRPLAVNGKPIPEALKNKSMVLIAPVLDK